MQYRELGNTGLKVSIIGLGCGLLGDAIKTKFPLEIVQKSLDYGVNYFDTAQAYGGSEIKLGQGLGDDRKKVYISSKTMAKTKEEAWKNIHESLERLQTDYIDNYHLHCLEDKRDIDVRLGSGGALEALIEARDQGLIRHIGCTSHQSRLLIMALKRFNFEVILHGKSAPIFNLSGAAKDILALSLRYGLYRIAARDVDFILFDEPTRHMDPENINKTKNAFNELKNQQLIIITVHDEFADAEGNKFLVEKNKKLVSEIKLLN